MVCGYLIRAIGTWKIKLNIVYSVSIYRRGVEQLAARKAHNLEVVGSNPTPATKPA